MISLLMLGAIINYLTRSTLAVAAPYLMKDLNITTQQYSWILSAFQFAIMLQPLAGYVLDVMGRAVVASFEALGREPPPAPFPRLQFADVMRRYGSDKPDLRFGLEIQDATELTRDSQFGVFAGAPIVTVPPCSSDPNRIWSVSGSRTSR